MAWSTVVKLCLIVVLCFTVVDYVNAQGNISCIVRVNLAGKKQQKTIEFGIGKNRTYW